MTGSTDGIGQHTALKLADAGADVIVHGRFYCTQLKFDLSDFLQKVTLSTSVRYRNPEKVAAACKRLSGKGGKITSYTCDLSSFAQIRKLTDKIKADFSSINVLINNAGVFEQRKMLSEDGFEMTWAINVLAPFLLTSLLKEIITERIVNVSSISASSRIDFDNLQQVTVNR